MSAEDAKGDDTALHLVPVTGERGLAGAFNVNVVRRALQEADALLADGFDEVVFTAVGKKGGGTLRFRGRQLDNHFQGFSSEPTFADAASVAEFVTQRFLDGETDRVVLVFNEFKSLVEQRVTAEQLLPVPRDVVEDDDDNPDTEPVFSQALAEFEPEPVALLSELLPTFVDTTIYRALLESAAAESIGSLLAAADCFGSLQRLALPGNDIFASGAEEIARALGRLAESAASSASSANNAASSAGVVGPAVNARYGAVDAGAVGPLRLRQLDLSDTKLSLMWEEGRLTQRPELVSKLLKGLGRAPMLTHLSLGGNMLCELAAKAVSTWLCQPSCRLQSLDFSRNPLGDAGGEQLVKALRTNASLSTLHLDECMLTDATCLRAIKALRRNKGSLRKLTLAWNGIEVLAAPLEQS